MKGSYLTIILTCIIVIAGYFSVSLISSFLPSYKNQLTEILNPPETYLLNFSDSDMGLNPLKWKIVANTQGTALSKEQIKKLQNTYVHEIILKMLYRDIVDPAITSRQLNEDEKSSIYDSQILAELGYKNEMEFFEDFSVSVGDSQNESLYIYAKTITTKSDNKVYEIYCVMDRKGTIWSYHCNEKSDQSKITISVKEKAYSTLANIVANNSYSIKSYLEYFKYLTTYYGQTQPVLNQVINSYLYGAGTITEQYQIITTDTELLLVFPADKSMILCFDPITYQFTGIYFET